MERSGAEGEEEDRVENDEEVDGEGPLLNQRQPELPPPEVNDIEKERRCPAEVQDGDPIPLGVLHKPGEAAEKRSDAQPYDDRNDDSDMLIKVRVRCGVLLCHQERRCNEDSGICHSV